MVNKRKLHNRVHQWDFVVWDRNREQSKIIAGYVQDGGHDEVRSQPGF